MRILQINTAINTGSVGRIVSGIGSLLSDNAYNSFIAFARGNQEGPHYYKIGNKVDFFYHIALTRALDLHGFGSKHATKKTLDWIETIDPDLIHLHNIHGYYLNIQSLFTYFRYAQKPIVWTFHDCWPITGHCSYFNRVNCSRWKKGCFNCPLRNGYPSSWFVDNSRTNFIRKKLIFTSVKNITLVSPSKWMTQILSHSFMGDYRILTINNGVDLRVFRPVDSDARSFNPNLNHQEYILGVANIWDARKGLNDFLELRKVLNPEILIVLIGLSIRQSRDLPKGIHAVLRTENIDELALYYSNALAFINPTWVDNFPTVNLEALSCGTPVVTYNTGGSPESIDDQTGRVVKKGDIKSLCSSIDELRSCNRNVLRDSCRKRSERLYDQRKRYTEYIELYQQIINAK